MNSKNLDLKCKTWYDITFSQSDLIRFERFLINLISNIESKLGISEEYKVIIPDDYKKDLIQFQKEKSLHEGFTDNEFGTGFGITLTYYENGYMKVVAFISKFMLFHAFGEDSELKPAGINAISHELAHVKDHLTMQNFYDCVENKYAYNNIDDIATSYSSGIWREYFASRLSMSLYTKDYPSDLYTSEIEHLAECISKVNSRASSYIDSHRADNDDAKLVCSILKDMSSVLKMYARLLGNIFFFKGERVDKEFDFIIDKIEVTFFKGILITLRTQLDLLYCEYPCFSKYTFCDLNNVFHKYIHNYGLSLEQIGCEIHLNIVDINQ
jgi:hypothetical protein